MTGRPEDSADYRLGQALGILRHLTGEFGTPHDVDYAMARDFIAKEEARTRALMASFAGARQRLRDMWPDEIKPLDGDSYDDAAAANEERDGNG